jgi:aminopeptidase-like protein
MIDVTAAQPSPPAGTPHAEGERMYALAARLYPICRSITGAGVRETLRVLGETIPVDVREVPSGTQVFDWTVPNEWNIRDAFVMNSRGERVIDFQRHNLHVVQYSVPVRARMSLEELRPRLHSLPGRPDTIPYRTSYYKETWGFCLSDRQLRAMEPGEYEVVIDASLAPGHLSYGELFLEGEREQEVLFHTHICHPSLANDNLSGIVVATFLADFLAHRNRRYSYRFVFLPGTIGPVTWLAINEERLERIAHGLVLTGIGDGGAFTYKRSRRGDALVDRGVEHLLRHGHPDARICDFEPYGYDERQYCSPAFNLPVGCLSRTPYGTYPEYHTSDDNLEFLRPSSLDEALQLAKGLVHLLECDRVGRNLSPKGEPQLGKRGLYRPTGGAGLDRRHLALLWVLNLSDGTRSLFEIAERSGLPFSAIDSAATELEHAGLLDVSWERS